MAIISRGNSHQVKIFVKGVLQKPSPSFETRDEAKEYEAMRKFEIILRRSKSHFAATLSRQPSKDIIVRPVLTIGQEAIIAKPYHAEEPFPAAAKPVEPTPAHPIVADMIDLYRKTKMRRQKGFKNESNLIDRFAKLALAKKPVALTTTADWERWQEDRIEAGVVNDTVNREHTVWRQIAVTWRKAGGKWPIDEDGVRFDPTKIKQLPACEARNVRLSPEAEECLLRYAGEVQSPPWFHLALRLCLEINLRRGELVRMKRTRINWEKKELILENTIVKNGETRLIPLTSRALAILREAVETIPEDNLGLDRVFPIAANVFSNRFDRARKAAAEEMPSLITFRLHDTRHEAISRMANRSKVRSTVILAKMTGHKDPKMLMRYVNPTSAELADMLE